MYAIGAFSIDRKLNKENFVENSYRKYAKFSLRPRL